MVWDLGSGVQGRAIWREMADLCVARFRLEDAVACVDRPEVLPHLQVAECHVELARGRLGCSLLLQREISAANRCIQLSNDVRFAQPFVRIVVQFAAASSYRELRDDELEVRAVTDGVQGM